MKRLFLIGAAVLALSTAAQADVLSAVKEFTLADVKQAEAIYAANPTVPTAPAAGQCLSWLDTVLSAPNAPVNFNLAVPVGVASTIADIDVALFTANSGLSPAVVEFNKNCGAYIEDLKAAAAVHAGGLGIKVFGLHL